jgi:hypothetical protein
MCDGAIEKRRSMWRGILLVGLMGVGSWLLVQEWALPPSRWGGCMLRGGDETDEQVARRLFGPVLLQSWLLQGPNDPNAFRIWGEDETSQRLILIIVLQWIAASAALLWPLFASHRRRRIRHANLT